MRNLCPGNSTALGLQAVFGTALNHSLLVPLAFGSLQLDEVKEMPQLETSLEDIRKQCGIDQNQNYFNQFYFMGKSSLFVKMQFSSKE